MFVKAGLQNKAANGCFGATYIENLHSHHINSGVKVNIDKRIPTLPLFCHIPDTCCYD